jgi:predicted transcriptional regulator
MGTAAIEIIEATRSRAARTAFWVDILVLLSVLYSENRGILVQSMFYEANLNCQDEKTILLKDDMSE